MKGRFYEELELIFNKFPKYHMKILTGDFNAKIGREDIYKQTSENQSLHEISIDNGVREVSSATFKNLIVPTS
jgi:exonuclease III